MKEIRRITITITTTRHWKATFTQHRSVNVPTATGHVCPACGCASELQAEVVEPDLSNGTVLPPQEASLHQAEGERVSMLGAVSLQEIKKL